MLSSVFLSLIIIVLAHYIYIFLKDTLTVPQVRDLVVAPVKARAELIAMANSAHDRRAKRELPGVGDRAQMRDELRTFMSELKRNTDMRPESASLNY